MARARRARLLEVLRKPETMARNYEKGLRITGKVTVNPEQLDAMKTEYQKVTPIIQPTTEVIITIRSLASGTDKVKLLNLYRAAVVAKAKRFSMKDIVAHLRSIIERNSIPADIARRVLELAGYSAEEIGAVLGGGVAPGVAPGL